MTHKQTPIYAALLGWLLSIFLSSLPASADVIQQFGANEHNASWSTSSDRNLCSLQQDIPEFGQGRFIREAGKILRVEFSHFNPEISVGTAQLLSSPPPWRHQREAVVLESQHLKGRTSRISFQGNEVKYGLSELVRGMDPTLRYVADNRPLEIRAHMAAIAINPAYQEFNDCIKNLFPYRFEHVKHSKLYFATDKSILTTKAKRRLDQVISYINADKRVISVRIDAYTDDRGFSLYNRKLGIQRAKAVHEYMLSKNISDERVTYRVRSFGEYKPHSNNKVESGRKLNRVATVDIALNIPEPEEDDAFLIERKSLPGEERESIFETPLFPNIERIEPKKKKESKEGLPATPDNAVKGLKEQTPNKPLVAPPEQ